MAKLRIRASFNAVLYMCIVLVIASFFIDTTTRQAVNQTAQSFKIPLGVKAIELFDRDYHYRQLAHTITRGLKDPKDKVSSIFNWTCENIRTDFPKGWPVIDDHVWNIVVRGYGAPGQTAEAFTTLCTYAGFPSAVYRARGPADSEHEIVVSVVRIGGDFYIFDTIRRNIFFNESGRLATIDEMAEDPRIAARAANRPVIDGIPYEDYFKGLKRFDIIGTVRPHLQMPLHRLWYEGRKLVGLEKKRKDVLLIQK